MRVVCVRLLDVRGERTASSAWVRLDSEYVVLAISAGTNERVQLRLIGDDGATPALFDAEMFMTVSSDLPSNWVALIGDEGSFDLAPATWLRPGFWQDYFDGNPRAIDDFETEKTKIYVEAGVKV